jgi:hypothetical protein
MRSGRLVEMVADMNSTPKTRGEHVERPSGDRQRWLSRGSRTLLLSGISENTGLGLGFVQRQMLGGEFDTRYLDSKS